MGDTIRRGRTVYLTSPTITVGLPLRARFDLGVPLLRQNDQKPMSVAVASYSIMPSNATARANYYVQSNLPVDSEFMVGEASNVTTRTSGVIGYIGFSASGQHPTLIFSNTTAETINSIELQLISRTGAPVLASATETSFSIALRFE
jgi:hypothetical protein